MYGRTYVCSIKYQIKLNLVEERYSCTKEGEWRTKMMIRLEHVMDGEGQVGLSLVSGQRCCFIG